jgi:hypothetical protein
MIDPQTDERRTHPRRQALFSCMQLEDENGGIVLNLSEGGLAMQVVRSLRHDRLPQMRFQLLQSGVWVEASGLIAWISPSRTTVGVEFVSVNPEDRARLREWLASGMCVLPLGSRAVASSGQNREQAGRRKRIISSGIRARRRIWPWVSVVLLFFVFVCLAFQLRTIRTIRRSPLLRDPKFLLHKLRSLRPAESSSFP